MFCKNCGTELMPEALFCKNCGTKVDDPQPITTPQAENKTNETNTAVPKTENRSVLADGVPVKPKKKSKAPIIILAVILALVIFGGAAFVTYNYLMDKDVDEDSDSTAQTKKESVSEVTLSPAPSEEPAPKTDIAVFVNQFIDSKNGQNDISVAVLDNKTGQTYYSNNASERYTAWGFYLPIYLAYGNSGLAVEESLASGVMSNDAGVCNQAGNKIIQSMGGPAGVTNTIKQTFRASVTSYGRYFADVNASGDNYTNAKEAVVFLSYLNQMNAQTALSYDVNKFGISAPAGAQVFAQVGTENNQVRKQLNLFSIVKGVNSDYCVAILTKNSAGTNISGLLEMIHREMEGMYA